LGVDIEKALKISCKYNIHAYDAYYLEVSKRLRLPLITFDIPMQNIAVDINITVLKENQNENI
jgi:predicted nucleic acid-binding protein